MQGQTVNGSKPGITYLQINQDITIAENVCVGYDRSCQLKIDASTYSHTVQAGIFSHGVKNANGFIGYKSGCAGYVKVAGSGSCWYNTGSLSIGNNGTGTLISQDSGLVIAQSLTENSGSVVQLYGGYLAIHGSFTTSDILSNYNIDLSLNGTDYSDATLATLSTTYYSSYGAGDALGFYATYGTEIDLTGYTIITNASPDLVVPEPASFAMFGGIGALGLVLLRKRKR